MPSTDVGSVVGQHVALRQVHNNTRMVPTTPTFGLKADMKIDNPYILMNQLSASVLWIEGGPPETSSAVQAGWVAAPALFPDTDTHLFTFWRDGPTKGGFNTDGGGFVQVDSYVSVGVTLEASKYGAEIVKAATFFIHQDMKTENWWLSLTGTEPHDIGYWPVEMVPNLRHGANYFSWGGIVRFLENASVPQMGTGQFPDGENSDASKVSAMWKLQFVDQSNVLKEPEDISLFKTAVDNRHCCDLKFNEHYRTDLGYRLFFGGPGGNC
ncbi:hypothetical protein C5167_026185 [Papaver somniferum]|uniref:uncharacterized protein LOC113346308 isoform X2 n=1 Tax=Papaver somniferum TaxID=3469 RepID=UPI000E7028EE|nr:uncharacterized protein LOC113346308 isoform X2 [Papaver somniferum]RZC94456.1 hypothetical protein C5167_026185 [Papaver somniferum]